MINNIDEMVLKYRESTNDRERNRIYKKLRSVYLPRVYKLMSEFPERYHDDIMSTYDWFLLQCIEKWKNNGALFTTYAYPYLGGIKLRSEVLEKVVKKSRREISFCDLEYEEDEYEDWN